MNKILLGLVILASSISCSSPNQETADAPLGWEILDTPVEASLRGLSALTPDIAWLSGTNGTWLRTLDGGKTWEHGVIDGLVELDFRSIHGFDAEKAIAVSAGQPAVIYKTIDGGITWKLTHQENEKAFLDGITFSDQNTGFVFGDPVDGKWMILKTVNQGDTWYEIPNLPEVVAGEAGFAASSSSLLASGSILALGSGGKEANLHLSENGGDTWEKFSSPLSQGEGSQGVFAVGNIGTSELICVGGDYLAEELGEKNLGVFLIASKEWVNVETAPTGYRSGVAYFDQKEWLITVGPNGSDFSSDGGKNWKNFSKEGFHAVKSGHAEGSVWASAGKGKVGKLKI